jgi:hypothetical protein
LVKITELKQFEKVCGNVCISIVLPKNAKINIINSPQDLKKVLNGLLRDVEGGEYPFLVLSLAPLAYGKVLKKKRRS